MSTTLVNAYELILTGANLDNWRALTRAQQDIIIIEANKRWNERTKTEEEKLGKKEEANTTKSVEISNASKEILATATSHIDKILADKDLFLSKFTSLYNNVIVANPFMAVTW